MHEWFDRQYPSAPPHLVRGCARDRSSGVLPAVRDPAYGHLTSPPGFACSIAFGLGLTDAEPGSEKGLQIVVDDAQAAHDHSMAAGVEVGDVEHLAWGSFVCFTDPDGNARSVQELPDRMR